MVCLHPLFPGGVLRGRGFADFCDGTDMKKHFVIDPLISKRQQLLLATQLCRMVLKVNNVIIAGSGEQDY